VKVSIISLGCKVNQSEGEDLVKEFSAAGIDKAGKGVPADIIIVNTCAVTGEADRKSRKLINQSIRKQAHDNAYVVVTGCYAGVAGDDVRAIPGVNMVVPQDKKEELVKQVIGEVASAGPAHHLAMTESPDIEPTQGFSVSGLRPCLPAGRSPVNPRHRAYLKIQDGCDNRCAYCIVPDARGGPRSLPEGKILATATEMSAGGTREIVLTGINIGKYRSDDVASSQHLSAPRLPAGKAGNDGSLTEVIKKLLETPGLGRIRLSSIEPDDVTDELADLLSSYSRIFENTKKGTVGQEKSYLCPHLHIPLQSGDDEVLRRMRRRYTAAEYREIVETVRAGCPDVAITTDIIVGFPGETDEAFQNTYRFLETAGIARLHVFKYSKRKGTPAAEMVGQVPEKVKAERSEALRGLSARLEHEYRKRFADRELDVLVEQISGKSLTGTSENYLTVEFNGDPNLVGQIVKVKLVD
jgi:threonylcarbamoyladenosine tRNA methylthiotransferase MtaB